MQRLLIIGAGDIAWRALPTLLQRYRVIALLRSAAEGARWRRAGATVICGDLDQPASLRRLAGIADLVLHLAPPDRRGARDRRTRHLVAALAALGPASLPRRLIYLGTSGVYGDRGGALIDETAPAQPQTPRAVRRLDAERTLRAFGRRSGVAVSILRAPGIYAADRLPRQRLQEGTPALLSDQDSYSNHIHAADLAAACCAALLRARPGRVYNVCDASQMKMGDYFDAVADACRLPRPPRISRAEAQRLIAPLPFSFMQESRRLQNRRLTGELRLRLTYPHVAAGLAELAAPART